MSRKVLFVGVGGSGNKTLSFLKQSLRYRLEAAGGDPDRMPRAWQFLAIDLPPVEQQISGVPLVLNGDSEYLGVSPAGKFYPMYDDELMGAQSVRGDFNRWRIPPMEVDQLPWLGAGQRRSVGRVAIVSAVAEIRNRIAAASTALNSVDTNREFLELPDPLRGDIRHEPLILVVGSLGGGSGSGALLDVCRIIEAQLREDVMMLAYLPSVFDNLEPGDRGGIPGNTFFAMSEMLNAIWDRGGDHSYLRRAGIEPFVSEMTGRGPAYPIAIGRGATGLGTDLQVFTAVAELLSEFILDDSYSTSFEAGIVNVYSNPAITMTSPLFSGVRLPFVSLGFSRFGLGRSRFGRYSAERLTHAALQVIAKGHIDLARDGDDTKAMAELPGREAGQELLRHERNRAGQLLGRDDPVVRFAVDCGLSELGEGQDNDQVIEYLYPTDRYLADEAELLGHVLDQTRGGSPQLAPTRWLQQFKNALGLQGSTHNEAALMRTIDAEMTSRAGEWAAEIPDQFRLVVTRALLVKGGWYTLALCEELDTYLENTVTDLRREIAHHTGEVEKVESEAQRIIGAIKAKVVGVEHDGVRRSIDLYFRGRLGHQFAVQRRLKAIAVLTSFQDRYLRRFNRSLKETMQGIRSILDSEEFANLSSAEPSVRLGAPATEFLVLASDQYRETFEDLASTLPGDGGTRDRLLRALFDDSRLDPRFSRKLRLVDFGELRATTDPQARSTVSLNISVQRFIDRAYAWFNSEDNALSNFINSDITRYLEDPTSGEDERRVRIEQLVSVFSQALAAGQPLVDADPVILQRMTTAGSSKLGTTLSMSTLPFAADSQAGRAFADALRRVGVDEASLPTYFATPGTPIEASDTINIATNSKALHPVLLVDYQRSVAERWIEEQGAGSFGTHRRAMRRAEAIPLPRETIVALSAGWDVGRALGMVRVIPSDAVNDAGPFIPEVLADGIWQPFPANSPEGPAYQRAEGFALMMESFGLTQISGALTANPHAPYETLFEIGKASTGTLPDGPLRNWILEGVFPNGAEPDLVPSEIALAGETLESRVHALQGWLKAQIDRQNELDKRSASLDYADRQHDFAELRQHGLNRIVNALVKDWKPELEAAPGAGRRTAGGAMAAD